MRSDKVLSTYLPDSCGVAKLSIEDQLDLKQKEGLDVLDSGQPLLRDSRRCCNLSKDPCGRRKYSTAEDQQDLARTIACMRRRSVRRAEDVPDEVEQEEIISDLRQQSEIANRYLRIAIVVLCLVTITSFMALNRPQTAPSLLSITSLAITIFILRYLSGSSSCDLDRPLALYLPTLNLLLAASIPFVHHARQFKESRKIGVFVDSELMPLFLSIITLLVRRSEARTELAIRDLELKKYNLRGA